MSQGVGLASCLPKTAWPPTSRTEHCNRERRAPRLSAPRKPLSLQLPDRRVLARCNLSPDRGRMLASAFRSPATNPAFTVSIPGSTFLACRFASLPAASTTRSTLRSATDPRVAPGTGNINAHCPLPLPLPASPAAAPASTPHQDCYIPTDQSVLPVCCKLARLPNPPDSRSLPVPAFYY